MMKFLAMFCLFIALFNEMEAKPVVGGADFGSTSRGAGELRKRGTLQKAEKNIYKKKIRKYYSITISW